MAVETGTVIGDLDDISPDGNDPILEGDNHIRLIKAILKSQFPGSAGQGYAIPIVATEAELNHLSGVSSNIQDQIDSITSDNSLVAPTGTVMVFYQSTPPVGWTQNTASDNNMLRVVNGLGGGSGGTDNPIFMNTNHNHINVSHLLTEEEIPDHFHHMFADNSIGTPAGLDGDSWVSRSLGGNNSFDYNMAGTIAAVPTLGKTGKFGGATPHTHNMNTSSVVFQPKYIDVITAVKD